MKKLAKTLIIFLISSQTFGQFSTLGTDFWVTWKQNNDDTQANCILYITSGVGATGTISMPGTGWT